MAEGLAVSRRGRSVWPRRGASVGLATVLGAFALLALIPTATLGQSGSAGCLPADSTAGPSSSAPPGQTRLTDSSGNDIVVASAATGREPSGVAIDGSDAYARTYVAARGADLVTVLYGRSPDLQLACRLAVGKQPYGVAVDAQTGRALIALQGEPRLAIVDGRNGQPTVVGAVDLPAPGGWVVIDPVTRRAFVSLPDAGLVAVLEPATDVPYKLVTTFAAGTFPFFMAVDPASGRLLVSDRGQSLDTEGDQQKGAVLIYDGRAAVPTQIGAAIPASVPTGSAFDPVSGVAWVLENGDDLLMTLRFPPGGPVQVSRTGIDRLVDAQNKNLNPVDLVLLPATRELVVTMALLDPNTPGHLNVLKVAQDGTPTWDRWLPSPAFTRGIALDPVTGRVFVAAVQEDRVAAYTLDVPSQPPPPPQTLADSMPSPLAISLAPQDVVRTVGVSLLVLLLVGAPTPLFNETLETHLGDIEGWLGRRVPRRRRETGPNRIVTAGRRFFAGPAGIVIYVVAAALIYSFLSPGFPAQNGLLIFGVAVLALGVATIADILPGERYVVGHYHDHGRIRVALWTLLLAAVCVLISRLAGLNPGYMYGIIGTFTFAIALNAADEGRMEAWGAVALLGLAVVTWFLRIPFEPIPGVPSSGANLIINSGLVGIFVVAVEGLVFGLVPLTFLPGAKIFAWSRWKWLLLWGAGLALFVHVLVYPVTIAQPNPSPASLTTTLGSVAIYGAIAVGFWGYFRWRAAKHPEGEEHAGAAEAHGESHAEAAAIEPPAAAEPIAVQPKAHEPGPSEPPGPSFD
jgi:DNA-binding beta-propeller fold protein YncE